MTQLAAAAVISVTNGIARPPVGIPKPCLYIWRTHFSVCAMSRRWALVSCVVSCRESSL